MKPGVRHVKKAEREAPRAEGGPDPACCRNCGAGILPADVAQAVRELVRKEVKTLRREELFLLRRGLLAEAADLKRAENEL